MNLDAALVAARFVHLLSLLLVAGALAFPHYASPARPAGPASGGRLLSSGALLALLAALAWFAATLGGMAGDPAAAFDPQVLQEAFAGTQFAPIWAGRVALLAALVPLTLSRPRAKLTAGVAALALGSIALTGHSRAETGAAGAMHVVADAMHLLTAGLWLGALPCLASLLRPGHDPLEAAQAVRRFSAVASAAVALLVITGAVQTWLLAGSPLALPGSDWGRLLLIKLALVAGMVALAAHNRRRVTPRIAGGDGGALLRRNALAELGLGAGVVAVVAWLGTLAPTAH